MPWVPWVADLKEGVNQGAFPNGLEGNVEVDRRVGRGVAQTLPAGWNGMPGMLDQHGIPRFSGRCEVDE